MWGKLLEISHCADNNEERHEVKTWVITPRTTMARVVFVGILMSLEVVGASTPSGMMIIVMRVASCYVAGLTKWEFDYTKS